MSLRFISSEESSVSESSYTGCTNVCCYTNYLIPVYFFFFKWNRFGLRLSNPSSVSLCWSFSGGLQVTVMHSTFLICVFCISSIFTAGYVCTCLSSIQIFTQVSNVLFSLNTQLCSFRPFSFSYKVMFKYACLPLWHTHHTGHFTPISRTE